MNDRTIGRIANRLGPELDDLGVDLYALDHNWSDRGHAEGQLARSDSFDGVAFHCYGGSPDQMVGFDVPVMVTECTGTTDGWYSTFGWDARELVVSAALAGSTGLMMWNLALDPQHGPKADWGCRDCRGLVTIDPVTGTVEPTPEFYTLAHVARAAEPGAVRVDASPIDGVPLVAFLDPDGSIGLFAQNDTHARQTIRIDIPGGTSHTVDIAAGDMLTLRWSLASS
jgi:glucosylceramidase